MDLVIDLSQNETVHEAEARPAGLTRFAAGVMSKSGFELACVHTGLCYKAGLYPYGEDNNGRLDLIHSLYVNVLARDPDAAGADAWMSYSHAGGTDDQIRTAFVGSAETQT